MLPACKLIPDWLTYCQYSLIGEKCLQPMWRENISLSHVLHKREVAMLEG
jgi:hypothetical protein